MEEITANIHIHTVYSDGRKLHFDILKDTKNTGVNVLFFSDHNIHPSGIEGYHDNGDGKVLLIVGEEIHDINVNPQKNHLLVFGVNQSYAHYADDRQNLINTINSNNGLSFLAHPFDTAMPDFDEPEIPWEDWSVDGFTGIEIWNGFSELKSRSIRKSDAYFYTFFPRFVPHSPAREILTKWDMLLNKGKKIVAIGGSDAHAIPFSIGFVSRIIFPYQYHFKTINNHILLKDKLSGNAENDITIVLNALREGNSFIANDLIRPSTGFRFFLKSDTKNIPMGASHEFKPNQKLIINLPYKAECAIIKNGKKYHRSYLKKEIEVAVDSRGNYRVECYRKFLGRRRGWIFSNPIYIE